MNQTILKAFFLPLLLLAAIQQTTGQLSALGLTPTALYPAMELTHVLQAKKNGEDTYTTMG